MAASMPLWHSLPVALFTRAWIEIFHIVTNAVLKLSPSLRGRGLKFSILSQTPCLNCRPLYEGVDWNACRFDLIGCRRCRPLYEGVDWNRNILGKHIDRERSPSLRGRGLKSFGVEVNLQTDKVALFTRAWIEMKLTYGKIIKNTVALFTRAWIEM